MITIIDYFQLWGFDFERKRFANKILAVRRKFSIITDFLKQFRQFLNIFKLSIHSTGQEISRCSISVVTNWLNAINFLNQFWCQNIELVLKILCLLFLR